MTANQIAAASVRVNEKVQLAQLDETKRHNQQIEEYNERIASAQEELNTINQFKADNDRAYQEWQKSWQRDYQAKWQEYQLAQEDMKIEIQQDLEWLEAQKVEQDRQYKIAQEVHFERMDEINAKLAKNEEERTKLQSDFNEFQKTKAWKELGLQEYDLYIRNKSVEYENANRHEQNVIQSNFNISQMDYKWAELSWERTKLAKQLENAQLLGIYNYNAKMAEIAQANKRLEVDAATARTQQFMNVSSGIFGRSGIIPGTVGAMTEGIKAFGGFNNGKTQRKIAEALLFGD